LPLRQPLGTVKGLGFLRISKAKIKAIEEEILAPLKRKAGCGTWPT
jgi:hypothetical protein